jgi:hypothetical protein
MTVYIVDFILHQLMMLSYFGDVFYECLKGGSSVTKIQAKKRHLNGAYT